jgi:hypothetical protein
MKYGYLVMLLMVALYTVAVYLLSLSKTAVVFDLKPVLGIPDEQYYKWETLMIAPVILARSILTSAIVYMMCRSISGKGSFDDTMTLLAYSIATPTYLTLIPDAVTGALSAVGALNQVEWNKAKITPGPIPFFFVFGLILIQVVWIASLFILSIRISHQIGKVKSVTIGIVCFMFYQSFLLIFLR